VSSIDSIADAYEALKRGFAEGRLAHAYLVAGAPEGDALGLAKSVLKLLFCTAKDKPCGECEGCAEVDSRKHPDILWVEPESKRRFIVIEQIRELSLRIAQTSYAGGWKAAVVSFADRMNEAAANAFLKTLEEPAGRSLLLLLTDKPQALLPTIVSRCQRVLLSSNQDEEDSPWLQQVLDVLRAADAADRMGPLRGAGRLAGLLNEARKEIEKKVEEEAPEDVKEDVIAARVQAEVVKVRSNILRTILHWQRDLMLLTVGGDPSLLYHPEDETILRRQAERLGYRKALANIRRVEDMIRRLDRNVPDGAVFAAGLPALFASAD
jgi:DNA polymerase III subunit delta'